jgi:hypothetical protein
MIDYTANMTSYDQAIELTSYLISLGEDLGTAASIAERRHTTPKQVLINLFTNEVKSCN